MIAERESFPEVVLKNAKALRLVHQRQAQNTEGLVFVSPQQDGSQRCEDCGKVYSPLIYQVDYEVESHHFHEEGEGGIYYCPNYRLYSVPLDWTGWVCLIETHGRTNSVNTLMSRSQKATVREIKAFCNEFHCKRQIEEGFVISNPDRPDMPGSFFPLCSTDLHPERVPDIKYTFRIDEGHVLFSQV